MDNKPDAKTCFTKGCTGVANSGLPLSARTAALADALGRAKARMDKLRPQKGRGASAAPDDAMTPRSTRAAVPDVAVLAETIARLSGRVDKVEADIPRVNHGGFGASKATVVADDAIAAIRAGNNERDYKHGEPHTAYLLATAPVREEGIFFLHANVLDDAPLKIAEHE